MFVEGKVALVTGGAFGLGFQFAKELLTKGAKGVSLVDLDANRGKNALETLTKQFGKGKVIFNAVDVVNKQQLEDAMKKTVEAFGAFDMLINNAGLMNDSIWEKEVDVNIKGLFNGCLLAFEEYLPKYKSGSEAVIVNISSTMGFMPFYFLPVYSGTKSAVIAITKGLAQKENYNSQKVRVLALCPGATATSLLDNLEEKSFTPRLVDEVKEFFKKYSNEIPQRPESVSEALVKILEDGGNGSVWVIRGEELFEIEIPKYEDLKILRRL